MPDSPFSSQITRFGPHAGAHRVALRAAVTVAVPLIALYVTDHLSWSVYAAFGTFAALYGRTSSYGVRVRMQLTAAAVFFVAVVAGTAIGMSDARRWWIIPVAAVFAVGVSMISDRQRWHPPGPLFAIFAIAACASIPSEPADLVPAAAVPLASGLFAVLVGSVGALLPGRRFVNETMPRGRVSTAHAVRSGVGVLISGAIATASGIGHPYWAMVSAVVPLSSQPFTTQLVRALQRVIGTFGGLVIAGLVLAADPSPLVLLICAIALQFGTEMLIGRNYALALFAVTPLALFMIHLASPSDVPTLILDRAVETVIGVAIGVCVAWLTRGRPPTP